MERSPERVDTAATADLPPGARSRGGVTIAGAGAVTALGRGLAALEDGMRRSASGLRRVAEFAEAGYQTDVAGMISEADRAAMRAAYPEYAGCRCFPMAASALAEAVSEAGAALRDVPPERLGLVLSTTKAEVPALEQRLRGERCDETARRHISAPNLAADLAAFFRAGGPLRCVSLACASGLTAIEEGAELILAGEADAALVVGVDVVSHFVMAGFSALMSLDPDGCKPFDRRRRGLSLGEGAGALVLIRPDGREMGRLRVTGWGSSDDANHLTGPSRDGSGLALAMERALARAGARPEDIGFAHGHGTGTVFNDAMECRALARVFGERPPPMSSSKGMTGHTLGAAGVIETILCALARRRNLLPGTPGLTEPDADVPASVLRGPREGPFPARMMKMNAGFGGVNAVLILEAEDGHAAH